MGEALCRLAQGAEDDERQADALQLLRYCVRLDPGATANFVDAIGDASFRELWAEFVIREWGRSDPWAALAWARSHPRDEPDHARFHRAYRALARKLPEAALLALEQPEFSGDGDVLSRIVVDQFDDLGRLAEVRAWVEKLPTGDLREMLVLQIMRAWSRENPQAAVTWLASIAPAQPTEPAMRVFFQTLAREEPRLAADLARFYGQPARQGEPLADVIYIWARSGRAEAEAWLRDQPPGPALDAAIFRLGESFLPAAPAAARAWAAQIGDPALRSSLLQRLP